MPPGSLTPLAMSARGTVYSHKVYYTYLNIQVYNILYFILLVDYCCDFGLTFLASVPPIKIQVTFQ